MALTNRSFTPLTNTTFNSQQLISPQFYQNQQLPFTPGTITPPPSFGHPLYPIYRHRQQQHEHEDLARLYKNGRIPFDLNDNRFQPVTCNDFVQRELIKSRPHSVNSLYNEPKLVNYNRHINYGHEYYLPQQFVANQYACNIPWPLPLTVSPTFDLQTADPIVVPDGLRPLVNSQGLLLNKTHEWFAGDRVLNKYIVSDGQGRPIFAANEITDKMTLLQSQRSRPFTISIVDYYHKEVIKVIRPGDTCFNCCPLFSRAMNEITVVTPAGQLIGSVRMTSSLTPTFVLRDQENKPMMKIEGSIIRLFDKDFAIYDLSTPILTNNFNANAAANSNQQLPRIGRISEESRFFGHDVHLSYPKNLTVSAKATLLGAVLLLEVLYFEPTFPRTTVSRVFV